MRRSNTPVSPLSSISEQAADPQPHLSRLSHLPALLPSHKLSITQHLKSSTALNNHQESSRSLTSTPTCLCCIFGVKKAFSSPGTLNQTSSILETHERAHTHTHTLSSYFAVQPRLAEDSCLQLSVITFYLFKRYLWMWAKSLYSDPLYFYYLQD